MSIAVDEVRDSIAELHTSQRRSLASFIAIDAALTALAVPFVFVVYLTVASEPYLLATGFVVALAAAGMAVGAWHARGNRLVAAVGWLAIGNWIAILTGAVMAAPVWPLFPLAALLPAVVAASYLRQDLFRYYLGSSIFIATGTTMLGLTANFTSIRDDVPEWVFVMLLAVFVPLLTAALGFLALQNFARVRAMIASLSDAYESVRSQAGDVRASRSRMLAAADRERRRIERDLHDGTQQHFVAISMSVAALKTQLPDDEALHVQVDRLREDVREAQRNLRDLTVAIYPPTLTEHGLSSAIRFIADRFSPNVTTRIDDVGRCDPTIEAAVYFTCMEALQNASKHAGPEATIELDLHRSNGHVTFVVADNGPGFDAQVNVGSGGIVNMTDRMAVVLGKLAIESALGQGTTIKGRVPVP